MKPMTIGKTESGKAFELPVDAATQTFAFIGRKGSGKTYAAGVFVEKMLQSDVQTIILDTVGNWYGLRIAANGKDSGFDIPVIGGLRGDIPLQAAAGATIADVAVETGRSMILDLSQFSLADRQRFAAAFGERIWRKKKAEPDPLPVHIVIEESQLIVPENVGKGIAAVMVGTYEEIIRLGRNYGIGVTMISQRPQSVNKEVLNQTECRFVLQVNGAPERDALRKWITHQGLEKGLVDELSSLPVGTAYVWSPQWLRLLERVKVGTKLTFDSTATPKAGKKQKRRDLKPLNLDDLQEKMKATIEEAKANDPKELRAEIDRLKSQLAAKPEAKADPESIQRAVAAAVERERQSIAAEYGRRERQFRDAIAAQRSHIANAREALELNGFEIPEPLELSGRPMPQIVRYDKWGDERDKKPKPVATPNDGASIKRSGGEYRIMAVLKQHRRPMSDKRLGILANLSSTSGTFDTYLSRLRKRGWIDGDRSSLRITADGDVGIGHVDPLPTGEEVIEWWRAKCGSGGMRRIFDALLSAYPSGLSREDVAKASDLAMSGSFDTYLSRLRTLGLLVGKGDLKACDELFQ